MYHHALACCVLELLYEYVDFFSLRIMILNFLLYNSLFSLAKSFMARIQVALIQVALVY